jgi:outer membrane protein insertion porin family
LRRPTKRNAVRADDFVAAVENLCIVRARVYRTIPALFLSLIFSSILPGFLRADSPFDGKIIQSIELQSDGPLNEISYTDLFNLLELRRGEFYSASQAERSIQRLFSTEMFHDVQVSVEPAGNRVGVRILVIRKYLIREVKFAGDLKLDRQRLRRELSIRSGEAYSAEGVDETLSRLGELYRRHGYYRTRIQPQFELHHQTARLSLTLQIETGDQEPVNRLDLRVEGDLNEEQILSFAKTREGMPFSRVQLEEDLKAIENHLILQGYLRCFVKETVRYPDDENGVSLAVFIDTRELTQIEFEGVEDDRKALADLPIFSQRGTAPFFLEATRKELRRRYQQRGYFLAQVEYETSGTGREPSRVVIKVDKGQRFNLKKIRFEGNQLAEANSLKKILSVEEEGVFSRGKFSTEMAEEDGNSIARYYQRRGYKDVKVAHALVPEGSDSRDLTLVFKIREGQLYLIDTVHFIGNEYLNTKTLFEETQGHPGIPFSPFLIAQDRANIMAAYANRGYREVGFRSEILYPEPGKVRITYFLRESPRSYTEQVILTGNHSTRENLIQREVEIASGEPLSLGRILATESNLYNLAIFNKVQVREVPSYRDPLHKNVMVNVEEAKKYTLLYGIGYSSFEGVRGTLGLANNNFLGQASTLSLGLRVGKHRQRANLSYNMSQLFERKFPSVISLTATNEKALTENIEGGQKAFRGKPFDEFRLIASTQTQRRLSRRDALFFRYNLEKVQITLPENLPGPLQFFRQEEELLLSSVSLSYLNESRDDPTDPHTGFLLSGDSRLSARLIGSDEDFLRLFGQGQYYRKLYPDLILASSLRLGVIIPFGETAGQLPGNPIPISERFFSGGSTTLRGLPQDLAGPLLRDPATGEIILVNSRGEPDPNGRPVSLGGNALLITNLELRFPLVALFSGTLFYDFGNVFRNPTDPGSGFNHAVGTGVQVNTPVGAIRFDLGYSLNPPNVTGFHHWNFHITLGQPF